jgi:hypothetical protein
MSFEQRLIGYAQKYRSTGVMLDTNLLLLYVFARLLPDMIGSSRLAAYDSDSADLLLQYLEKFERVLTTAHVLAETSNLARQMVKGEKWKTMSEAVFPLFCLPDYSVLKPVVIITETIDPMHFSKLGLTDAALANSAGAHLLLTADLDLYCEVVSNGQDAVNFTHMREAAGLLEN